VPEAYALDAAAATAQIKQYESGLQQSAFLQSDISFCVSVWMAEK